MSVQDISDLNTVLHSTLHLSGRVMLRQQKYVSTCIQVTACWSCETQGEGPIHKRQNHFPNQLISDPGDP